VWECGSGRVGVNCIDSRFLDLGLDVGILDRV
jgi:hypothetical protein